MSDDAYTLTEGMSLRDYFAANATDADIQAFTRFGDSWKDPRDRVAARYAFADAMLAEREHAKDGGI